MVHKLYSFSIAGILQPTARVHRSCCISKCRPELQTNGAFNEKHLSFIVDENLSPDKSMLKKCVIDVAESTFCVAAKFGVVVIKLKIMDLGQTFLL